MPPWVDTNNMGLLTDLYELTMMQAYFETGRTESAVFSLFVRRLPESRNFLVAAGLESVLDYLEGLHFNQDHLDYLASLGRFNDGFLRWLETLRFEGEVRALPEGTPFFADEPILEIAASLPQAQLVETFVMNQISVQTVLASKAVRFVLAAEGRPVVDFGPRRMHGTDAALKGARAFYIAGLSATSNVLAGRVYDVPVTGTMAHSYIESYESELDAFRSFTAIYPDTVLLVDTYDTLEGVHNVVRLARERGEDFRISAIRLDSGDLAALAAESRRILDAAGLSQVKIFASGGLDESAIAQFVQSGAPIDAFGVGTHIGVSQDAPSLDIAYKLTEYEGKGRMKLSAEKATLPGRKQVFRSEREDRFAGDVIGCEGERLPGTPLLRTVMRDGRRLPESVVELAEIRSYAQEQVACLPQALRRLDPADPPYPVTLSAALKDLGATVRRRLSPVRAPCAAEEE